MDKKKSVKSLEKDVARIYYALLTMEERDEQIKGVRCYESARIFCNVLMKLGYNVEVVNGSYVLSDNEKLRHSWVEQIVDYYGKSILIETTPHQFFPDPNFKELVKRMIIPPDDEKRKRYVYVSDEVFLEALKFYARAHDQEYRKLVSLTLSEWLSIHERARGLGLSIYLILVRL